MQQSATFIYPDLLTAFVGLFEVDQSLMIEAFRSDITGVMVNPFGILQPSTALQKDQNEGHHRDDQINKRTICNQPLIEDPYEQRTVYVNNSRIPNAGEGLFAKRLINEGQLVAFFHGIPLANTETQSEYSISHGEASMIDIPQNCRSTEVYRATLAHKICHSFVPNAKYSYAFHPKFGHIRCVIAIKDIQVDEEITCNYKYKLEKAPEWYKECLKQYLQENSKLNDSEISKVIVACNEH